MSICLSVASNLRCSNLSLPQAQALLVLPALDIVFCAGIIKVDWGEIKHHQWAIIVEAIVYFCLTLFDYLDRAKAKSSLDITTFATYDKAIGVLTMFPLFFYCASILLLAHTDILPLTTSRTFSRLIQISLVATTPLILLFNELAGLLGITYQIVGGRIYLGFVDKRADNVAAGLTGTALAFLAYFQFVIGVACIFYIVRARSRGHGGGVIVGFTCCGSGLLLGTLETLLGFGHQGFPLTLTRKIFRTTARALLITGMLLGTSVDEGFALYPSRGRPMTERRGSAGLRAMISNPRTSTFAHLSPRATVFHNNHSASRLQGLARSDSSSSTNHLMMSDPRLPIENIPPSRRQAPVENIPVDREQDLASGLVLSVPAPVTDRLLRKQKRRQTDGIYFSYALPNLGAGPSGSRKVRPGFNAFDPEEMAKLPVRANKPGDRVTIHFPGGDYTRAPVLELRLSDLKLPSPRAVADSLRTPDGTSMTGNHSHAGLTLEDGSSQGDGHQAAARRKIGLPPRPREVSFSEAGSGRTPRENGARFPSRPLSARLSRRWSSFTGSRGSPGGSWKALADEHDDPNELPLEPPQPAFVVREERASTPRSSRSRISESESIWLRGSTLPPPPPASSGEQLSPQQRSTWHSEDYEAGTPATPRFAAKIVEARAVSVRPHWSTAFIYHPRLPSGEGTPGPSSSPPVEVPFPIAPSPLKQLANHAKEKEAQFEADFQTGLTRQIYVGERRVSRAPHGTTPEPEYENPYGREGAMQPEPALVQRPRLSDRAADMEYRRRSPKRSESNSDESQSSLRRMSRRFRNLQSTEEAATTIGHSVGSTDEVRSLVRGFGTVVSRRPTLRSNSGERESVTLEHASASTPSMGLNTLQQVFGQRYSFDARPTIPESEGEVESVGTGRMPRSDSGIFGRDNSF